MGAERQVLGPLSALGKDKIIQRMCAKMLTTQDPRVQQLIRDRANIIAERKRDEFHKIHPHRPFSEVMPDGAWAGERCFIIGGGPSLEGFDFERLRGQGKIIAINKAFLDVPFADILFFMDGSNNTFYGLLKRGRLTPDALQKWGEFQGYKVFLNLIGRRFDDVYSVRSLGRVGISNSVGRGIYHGNNSGTAAVGLAVSLKTNPIYLLGIDCKFKNGKSHYHGGYPNRMGEGAFKDFIRDFIRLNRILSRTNYKVINLNPNSGLRCFPFSTIDEVLR